MTRPTLDQEPEPLRVMWYGDPGKGKTTALATLARRGKVVYIDAEKGLKGRALSQHNIPIDNIEPFRDISYEALLGLLLEVEERLADGEKIVGLVWDTVTSTLPFFVENIVAKGVDKAARMGRERSEFDVFQEDYGTMTEQMRKLLRRIMDLPIHVGVSAHARRDTDEEGAVRVGPAMTPALQRDMLGYFDIIIHARIEDNVYAGATRPVGKFEAKERFGILPAMMPDPSFERILDYFDGELTRENDPLLKALREKKKQTADAK